jgi:TetR/AcrR family transcriptional repressor of nem operon
MTVSTRDTKSTIVASAADLFRKQGYAATTMQHVAEATGISKGNLTYHFPSKHALYEEVHRQAVAYLRERILGRSFEESATTVEAVGAFTRRVRRWFLDEEGHFVGCIFTNIAVETQHADPAIGQLARSALTDFKAYLAERFAEGQARGEVRVDRTATQLAQAFFWAYEGALTLSRAMDDPSEYDDFAHHAQVWLVG